jgi:hypothetical protein
VKELIRKDTSVFLKPDAIDFQELIDDAFREVERLSKVAADAHFQMGNLFARVHELRRMKAKIAAQQ